MPVIVVEVPADFDVKKFASEMYKSCGTCPPRDAAKPCQWPVCKVPDGWEPLDRMKR